MQFINVGAGIKSELKPRVDPNSLSCFCFSMFPPQVDIMLMRRKKKGSQSNDVIPVTRIHLSQLAFDVLLAPRLSVQEMLCGLFPRGTF